MLTNKKRKFATTLAALSMFVLVGCDTTEIKYPNDYTNKIYEGDIKDGTGATVKTAQDTLKQYYQSLTNDDAVYEKTTKKLFTLLADNIHGFDEEKKGATYSVVNDTLTTKSIADSYSKDAYKVNDNLKERSEESLFSTAKSGTYKDNNMWDEASYAKYLEQNYYYLNEYKDGKVTGLNTDQASLKNMLVTPEMTYSDVYSDGNKAKYEQYMQTELYDDFKINYLTAEYIMKETPASIGNTNARKVQVVAIADRSDEPGDAIKLLTAYVNSYILHKDGFTENDDDFSKLTKYWKGITVSALCELSTFDCSYDPINKKVDLTGLEDEDEKEELKEFFARYLVTLNDDGSVVINPHSLVFTPEDENFFKNNTLNTEDTLLGKVLLDKSKIDDGLNNWHKIDSSLESTYTGSYTYDVKTGYRNAIDDIVIRDLITDGTYLKSSGISALPSAITDRIFSPKVTSKKSDIDAMKEDVKEGSTASLSSKKDLTVYAKDQHRYLTVADTITSDDVSSILYYDASSKTYYITRILDVVDTNAISGSDSIYDTDDKKNQLKAEVAYEMSTTGSYKTDSGVYWLSRMDFTYSDEDFLEYIKTNYKDVFKTENPYSSLKKISLKDFAA